MFDETGDSENEAEAERFCDKVAVEFLMPADVFVRLWETDSARSKAVRHIVRKLKVSYITCIRRAKELALIDESTFWQLFNEHKK